MRRGRRRGAPVLVAAILAVVIGMGLSGPLAPIAAAAVAPDALVTGAATYTVDPAGHAVHVAVDMTVEDVKPDTSSTIYYLTGYRLAIQPEASGVRVTHGTTTLADKTSVADGYIALEVTFPARLFRGHTQAFRVQYDLPDGGPRTSGRVRVAPGVAAFYAWSYGADRASVHVILPGDCEPATQGDPLVVTRQGGLVQLAADSIRDRATWLASITATCPDQLTTLAAKVQVDGTTATVEVHGFPDDPTWATTVTDRLTRGLPILTQLVGLGWPVVGPLDVTEAYTPSLAGYAGFYEPPRASGDLARIEISEDPAPLVIVHEASHAWFNDQLFQERWIDEGLANAYGSLVLAQLGDPSATPDPVQREQAGAFPLEAWPAPGAITDKPTQLAETYGYDASWALVRQFVTEVGADRMRLVFKAAAAHQIAYAGRPAPETLPLPDGGVDWREFLDLLEQVGGARDADTLFDTWVLPPSDAGLMAQHEAAIQQYAQLLAAGRGWLPGAGVRLPLATWDFAEATTRVAEAQAVLQLRDRIQDQAGSLGVAAPQALQASYEAATGDLATTLAVAEDELTTIAAIQSAHLAVVSDHDPFVSIGLLGSAPQAALDGAGRAFAAGDDAGARAAAGTALTTISAAAALGQERVALIVALLAVLLLAVALLAGRRRRREPRGAVVMARPAGTLPGDAASAAPLAPWTDPRSEEPPP